ncbi:MAG: beta-glucuronidase [Sphaerochaetaceae bacterium]|nr:beta-glucuronidase [Sphaerochaetaceae bacterium]
MLYPIVNEARAIISLDGNWEFRFADEEEWRTINVPASFNNQIPEPKARFYAGIVEYKRTFVVPMMFQNERLVLRFDAITHDSDIFIDGNKIVSHKGGFLPFECEITDIVNCGITHQILIRVDNRINHHSFPMGNESGTAFFGSDNPGIPSVENGKKKLSGYNLPNFDFFNYAGITRSVRIYTTPKNYIKDITVTTFVTGKDAIVKYEVLASASGKIVVDITDAKGNIVGSSDNLKDEICIKEANLWNPWPGKPYLYKLVITFNSDKYELPFGIRTVEVKGKEFFINGKPFYFKGVGKHEDSFIRGRGVDCCLNVKDVGLLKWLGANSFRTSHYPYDEDIYQLCDREGIVIIDELPAVGLNFQGALNPYTLGNEQYHMQLLNNLIQRDKNHPSVVMWSLGNEPDSEHFPQDAYDYWHPLYLKAHELDPQNRPVTMVCCQNDYTRDITTRTMDVVCINRYYGWYNLAGNLDIAQQALEEEFAFWTKVGKPIILAEYGADAISGMHAVVPEMFTEEYQVQYLEKMNAILDKFDFVVGEMPWNFADFDTQQGPMRAGGNHKGLFNRDRTPKMAAYAIKKRWTEELSF